MQEPVSVTSGCHHASARFEGFVRRAFNSQATLFERDEHCSLDPVGLALLGLVPGSQVRVIRSPEQLALYTVSETRPESIDSIVRMALPARQRLGTMEEFDAIIDGQVPHPSLSDAQAEEHSEFVERLDDNGCQRRIVVLAPHGGAIERHTDSQAERFAAVLGSDRVSSWRCKGFKTGGGAFERWHITSTDIHEASFPLLRTIASRGFSQAVAFHGFSKTDVLIGGAAPETLKEEIRRAIAGVLAGSGIEVRIADPSEHYDGDSERNIVNRLTTDRANGIQIEQSLEARNGFWTLIADAVAAVYAEKVCW